MSRPIFIRIAPWQEASRLEKGISEIADGSPKDLGGVSEEEISHTIRAYRKREARAGDHCCRGI